MLSNKIKFLKKCVLFIKYKIVERPQLKQEQLLRLALKEKGFNTKKLKISIDHDLGLNYVNGLELGIKYPDSFFHQATTFINAEKPTNYYFNGNMAESGGRKKMLNPFINLPNSAIIESNDGRIENKKNKFNEDYFQGLGNSKFGLCPHQADWQGNQDALWTYRFIECCFVETIPVLFKETPLGNKFIKGFHYLWAEELLLAPGEENILYNKQKAEANKKRAKDVFCLSEDECKQIRSRVGLT